MRGRFMGVISMRAKGFLPNWIVMSRRRRAIAAMRARNSTRACADVFAEIYSERLWGDGELSPLSGSGSTSSVVDPYISLVGQLIGELGVGSIVDVGCGDFTVGQRVAPLVERYVGVDLVASVVERNIELYGGVGVGFACLDATRDPLPDGDLCLVRQVLQHLSNSQIASALRNLSKYEYVLITEHYPSEDRLRAANTDKPHGADTRVVDGSAVVLSEAPFMITAEELLRVNASSPLVSSGETIRSFLWRPSAGRVMT